MKDEKVVGQQGGDSPEAQFHIHRVYLKDMSFETPNSPDIFQNKQNPQLDMQVNTQVSSLDNALYEVILVLTVTAVQGDKTAFLVEVHQAGLFTIQGFEQEQTGRFLGVYCPSTLFPFARETVASQVARAGFPNLLLPPVNFDSRHQEHVNTVRQRRRDRT